MKIFLFSFGSPKPEIIISAWWWSSRYSCRMFIVSFSDSIRFLHQKVSRFLSSWIRYRQRHTSVERWWKTTMKEVTSDIVRSDLFETECRFLSGRAHSLTRCFFPLQFCITWDVEWRPGRIYGNFKMYENRWWHSNHMANKIERQKMAEKSKCRAYFIVTMSRHLVI